MNDAIKAGDDDELKELCRERLDDPFLPRMFRADFNILLSVYEDEDPHYRLEEATRVFQDMEEVLAEAGVTQEDRNISQLKMRVATLLERIIDFDDDCVEETEVGFQGAQEKTAVRLSRLCRHLPVL